MNIKMIVSDLDNTLLNHEKEISSKNAAMLKKSFEHNIKIVFASARHRESILQCAKGIPLSGTVCSNGCISYAGDHIIGDMLSIDSQKSLNIIEAVKEKYPKVPIMVPLFTKTMNIAFTNYNPNDRPPHLAQSTYIDDFTKMLEHSIHRIMFSVHSEEELQYIDSLLSSEMKGTLHEGVNYIISHIEAHKMRGVDILAKHWNIKKDEILCFGDDYNDLEMIKGCGHSVAMKNAVDEIKNAARYITDTNEESGVGNFIEKYVF